MTCVNTTENTHVYHRKAEGEDTAPEWNLGGKSLTNVSAILFCSALYYIDLTFSSCVLSVSSLGSLMISNPYFSTASAPSVSIS